MRKAELMKYAASIGVKTRKEGTKNYRSVEEVRADCATARQDAPAEPPDEFAHMRKYELRHAAVLLRVSIRKAGHTTAELRASCRRAAAGQLSLHEVLSRGSASRGGAGNARAVVPNKKKWPRSSIRPMWLRKPDKRMRPKKDQVGEAHEIRLPSATRPRD